MTMKALGQLAWNGTIFKPEKTTFFELLRQFIHVMRLDHICFILESKNTTLRFYPWQFQFSLNLMAQAGKVRQRLAKQHNNVNLAGLCIQTPPQKELQVVISGN